MEKQTNGHRPLFRNILMFFMLSFGLLCPILPAQGQEQKIQVSGIVKDKTGETVIGAAVPRVWHTKPQLRILMENSI